MYNNKTLADRFNRKKTILNDLNRFQNIHQKIKHKIHIATYQPITTFQNFQLPNTATYQFNNNTSTYIDFDIPRENLYDKIPKIEFKDVPIPSYSLTDKFDLNNINQNISTPIHMDIFTSDIINEGDVNRIKKKGIHKIFHVYQQKYADNSYPLVLAILLEVVFLLFNFALNMDFSMKLLLIIPSHNF